MPKGRNIIEDADLHAVLVLDSDGEWQPALNGEGGPAVYHSRKAAWKFSRDLAKHMGRRTKVCPAALTLAFASS